MKKKILLVEPAYKTKYPPLGLMKISTYHKMKGDDVVFVKGRNTAVQYQYWDRVYIGTLFTWTWKETIETIKFYSATLFNYTGKCFIGGILASLLPDDLFNETGIQPVEGLLNDPKKIDQDDDVIIDDLPPDYEILKQVENVNFKYSNTESYLGYTTRGCVRKCGFCAVRTFEPTFIPYVDIKKVVKGIIAESGEKQNLILMDNNVLASPEFDHIIDDIKELGFVKGAAFGKTKRKRIVDYNQGLDARYLDDTKMKRLAEIPVEPMRLAFDSISLKRVYLKAVRLAHAYGQKEMSNYILYNFDDTPEDFYERLKINIDLNEEFKNDATKTSIYSFPMRYIPLDAKDRDIDTGNDHWNRKYLRAVQVILNVMKGPVMPGKQFFMQAFGRDSEEFKAIMSMPEEFIRNRLVGDWRDLDSVEARWMPYVREWMTEFSRLSSADKELLMDAIGSSDNKRIQEYHAKSTNRVKKLLEFHLEEDTIVTAAKRQNSTG
jgi:hypothetical protein